MDKSVPEVVRLLTGEIPAGEIRPLVRRLLRRRGRCHRSSLEPWAPLLQHAWNPPVSEAADAARGEVYEPLLERVLARVDSLAESWRHQRREARAAAAALHDGSWTIDAPPRRWAAGTRGPAWVQALLESSFSERYRDPEKTEWYAFLATEAAAGLGAETGASLQADWQARAAAEHGNALRIREKFAAARQALGEAWKLSEEGTGDPLLQAWLCEIQAALDADQRHFPDAEDFLQGALRIYDELGETHLAGRVLIRMGLYADYGGDPAAALARVREGTDRIDRRRDPQLAATADQLLIWTLAENGEYQEAGRRLRSSGLCARLAGEPLNLLKLRWVEGQIWEGQGELDKAELALLEARDGLERAGKEYTAAVVGLDLAAVWLQQGRLAEVGELAQEMLESFEDLGFHREARRALGFLVEACRLDNLTLGHVRHVFRFLLRREHNPGLRFRAPAV